MTSLTLSSDLSPWSLMRQTYSLSEERTTSVSLTAFPSVIGSTPLTYGSSVPP